MLKVEKRYFSRVTPLLGIGRKDFNFSPFKAEAQPFLALKGGPKLADTRKSMKLANVDRRIIAEDYRTSTWDPIAGRSARPGIGSDGQLGHAGFAPGKFDTQDNVEATMATSTWELGFDEPVEMYPDSPVEEQPDLWLIRRVEPETDVRFKNTQGWYDKIIYRNPEDYFVHKTSNRLPKGVDAIMREMNLFRLNDWSIQFNTAEVNEKLWLIKPYIVVAPIRLPDGLPDEDNIEDFRLMANGKLIDTKKRMPKHVQDVPKPTMRPVKSLNIDDKDESLRTGISTELLRSRYSGSPMHHEGLWNFDGDSKPTRRYDSAPAAWSRGTNFTERYYGSKRN